MDQSFIVAEELVAVQEYDPCELKEQGESAEYAGEAFAKQAVQEYVPSEWKVQGKSEESFGEALAKYAVQEYAHAGGRRPCKLLWPFPWRRLSVAVGLF